MKYWNVTTLITEKKTYLWETQINPVFTHGMNTVVILIDEAHIH